MRALRGRGLLRLGRVHLPLAHDPGLAVLGAVCLVVAAAGTVAVDQVWLEQEAPASAPPSPFVGGHGLRMIAPWQDGPAVGEEAPDFTLPEVSGHGPVRLSSLRGRSPVVLVFGSFT